MSVTFKNPTNRAKAVKTAGGYAVIAPGKTEKVNAKFTKGQIAKYEEAGLEIGAATKAKAEKPSTEKSE